jgi:hypothetical protein
MRRPDTFMNEFQGWTALVGRFETDEPKTGRCGQQ